MNQSVFITGGSSGIGKETAIEFAKRGVNVAIADVSDNGELVVKEIEAYGVRSMLLKCDVSNSAQVEESINRCLDNFGSIEFAFNNAGVPTQPKTLIDTEDGEWDRIMNVNLKGVWLAMKYQLKHMVSNRRGSIVNMGSTCGHGAIDGLGAFGVAKAGVDILTRTAAQECKGSGVRINTVVPGLIITDMTRPIDGKFQDSLLAQVPLERSGTAEEVAKAVVWLAMEATYTNGTSIFVDGGWHV